jgi:DNA-binding NarL/FixJ family response regulator
MMEMKAGHPINVVLLSDCHITLSGLHRILESQPGFHVLAEGNVGGGTIVESLVRQRPVVLLDLDPNGVDALRKLEHLTHSLPVIVLCDLGHHELNRQALALGAAGIVLKTQPPSVLIATIQSLSENGGPDLNRTPIKETTDVSRIDSGTDGSRVTGRLSSLTAREQEIVRLISAGLKNKEVANRLHISDITVRHHLTNIFSKLDVPDRQKLLILAHRHGMGDVTPIRKAG